MFVGVRAGIVAADGAPPPPQLLSLDATVGSFRDEIGASSSRALSSQLDLHRDGHRRIVAQLGRFALAQEQLISAIGAERRAATAASAAGGEAAAGGEPAEAAEGAPPPELSEEKKVELARAEELQKAAQAELAEREAVLAKISSLAKTLKNVVSGGGELPASAAAEGAEGTAPTEGAPIKFSWVFDLTEDGGTTGVELDKVEPLIRAEKVLPARVIGGALAKKVPTEEGQDLSRGGPTTFEYVVSLPDVARAGVLEEAIGGAEKW